MRSILSACLLVLLLAMPALAQQGQQPRRLGSFQSWTAATYNEAGQKVCYAFSRASKAEGVVNRPLAQVLLTVTHRPDARDQVALRAGYPYPRPDQRTATAPDPVQLVVGSQSLPAYTHGDTAFLRVGANAVRAFRGGREVVARGPGPNNRTQASDTFPLAGFAQAYEAISRECPAAGAAPARR